LGQQNLNARVALLDPSQQFISTQHESTLPLSAVSDLVLDAIGANAASPLSTANTFSRPSAVLMVSVHGMDAGMGHWTLSSDYYPIGNP